MSTITVIEELSSPTLKISLVTPIEPGKSFTEELEERLKPTIPFEKLEQLYFTSGLVFKIVDKWATRIAGQGYYFEGSDEITRQNFETWAKQIKLQKILEEGVRDIFLAGGCWGEKVLNNAGTEIVSIKTLNPKTMDFIRVKATDEVDLMEDGTPVGYERKYKTYKKIQWKKDEITTGGARSYKAKAGEDCRDRIYYFKFWGLSESFLGYTPLVSIYKDELIRLNIADGIGESAFRGTGIIATIKAPEGTEIPSETMEKLESDLKEVRSKTIFVFPENIKLDRFPTAEMKEMHYHLDFFTNSVCTGLGIKRELLMTPSIRLAGIDITSAKEDFEHDVMILQEKLAEQVNEQIIQFRAKLKNIRDVPVFKFRTSQKAIKLSQARRRATLARSGLLTYDPELEIKIRDEEGLPHALLDKEKESWKSSSRVEGRKKLEIMVEETIRRVLEEYGKNPLE